jgi:diaminopimelate decarboxylase
MSHFRYVRQKLFVEKSLVSNIVKTIKTPFYLYSEQQIKDNYRIHLFVMQPKLILIYKF